MDPNNTDLNLPTGGPSAKPSNGSLGKSTETEKPCPVGRLKGLDSVKKLILKNSIMVKQYQQKCFENAELVKNVVGYSKKYQELLTRYQESLQKNGSLGKECAKIKGQYDVLVAQSNKYISKEVFEENSQLRIQITSLERFSAQLEIQNKELLCAQGDTSTIEKKVEALNSELAEAKKKSLRCEELYKSKVAQIKLLSKENETMKGYQSKIEEATALAENAIEASEQKEKELSEICSYIFSIDPPTNEASPDRAEAAISKLKRIVANGNAIDKDALANEYQAKLAAVQKENFKDMQVMEESYKSTLKAETRKLQDALAKANEQNELLTNKLATQSQAHQSTLSKAAEHSMGVKPSALSDAEALIVQKDALIKSLQEKLCGEADTLKKSLIFAETQRRELAEKTAALNEANVDISNLKEENNRHKDTQGQSSLETSGLKSLEEELAKKDIALGEANANILSLEKEVDGLKAKVSEQSMQELEALMNEELPPSQDSLLISLKEELKQVKQDKDNEIQSLKASKHQLESKASLLKGLLKEVNEKSCQLEASLSRQKSEGSNAIHALNQELEVLKVISLSGQTTNKAGMISVSNKEYEQLKLNANPKEMESLKSENNTLLGRLKACQRELSSKQPCHNLPTADEIKSLHQQLKKSEIKGTSLENERNLLKQQLHQVNSVMKSYREELSKLTSQSILLPQNQEELVSTLHKLLEAPHLAPDFKASLQQLILSTDSSIGKQEARLSNEKQPSQDIARLTCENKLLLAKYSKLKETLGSSANVKLSKVIAKNKVLSAANKKLMSAKLVLQESLTEHMMKLSKLETSGSPLPDPSTSDSETLNASSFLSDASPEPQQISPIAIPQVAARKQSKDSLSASLMPKLPVVPPKPQQVSEKANVCKQSKNLLSAPVMPKFQTALEPQQVPQKAIACTQPSRTTPNKLGFSQQQKESDKRTNPDSTSENRPSKRHMLEKQTPPSSSESSSHKEPKAKVIINVFPFNPRYTTPTSKFPPILADILDISNAINKFSTNGQLSSTRLAKFKHLQGREVAAAIISLIQSHSNNSYSLNSSEISYLIDERSLVVTPAGCMSTWEAQLIAFTVLHVTAFPGQATLHLVLNNISRKLVAKQTNPTFIRSLCHIFAFLCKLAQDSERMCILLYDLLAHSSRCPHLLLCVTSLSQVWGVPYTASPDSPNLCIDVFQALMASVFPLAEQYLGPAVAACQYYSLVTTLGWQPLNQAIRLDQIMKPLLKGYEDPQSSPDAKDVYLRLISLIRTYSCDEGVDES